jgi:hypothetical protein
MSLQRRPTLLRKLGIAVASSCRCSELLSTSCLNGSFLECSPPTHGGPGSIPGRDMSVSGRVVDPYSFFPDPDPEFNVVDQYGSGYGSGS